MSVRGQCLHDFFVPFVDVTDARNALAKTLTSSGPMRLSATAADNCSAVLGHELFDHQLGDR
jgi:hypothetical protein